MKQEQVMLGQTNDRGAVPRVMRLIGRVKEYGALVESTNSILAMPS